MEINLTQVDFHTEFGCFAGWTSASVAFTETYPCHPLHDASILTLNPSIIYGTSVSHLSVKLAIWQVDWGHQTWSSIGYWVARLSIFNTACSHGHWYFKAYSLPGHPVSFVAEPRNRYQTTPNFLEDPGTSNITFLFFATSLTRVILQPWSCYWHTKSVALGWQLWLLLIVGSALLSQTDLIHQIIRCHISLATREKCTYVAEGVPNYSTFLYPMAQGLTWYSWVVSNIDL